MTKAAVQTFDYNEGLDALKKVTLLAQRSNTIGPLPSWISECSETVDFVKYWFGIRQYRQLSRISIALDRLNSKLNPLVSNALKLAVSRIIVTKTVGASLAWDVSHGRPHKVKESNNFEVLDEYPRAAISLMKKISGHSNEGLAKVELKDVRDLKQDDCLVDSIITSPPYLNAIDYMRGHKFSLIWLGYTIPQLRELRAVSIGAERRPTEAKYSPIWQRILSEHPQIDNLSSRHYQTVRRYISDLDSMVVRMKSVLKGDGTLVIVTADSQLKSVKLPNSDFLKLVAEVNGLSLKKKYVRAIQANKRYLPVMTSGSLSKRMTKEVVQIFSR